MKHHAHEGRGARTWVAAGGSFLAAFVASSHHGLHMMLISLGLGAGALVMTPGVRRFMLAASLAMAAFLAVGLLRRPERPTAQLVASVASICLSAGLVAYTVIRDGW